MPILTVYQNELKELREEFYGADARIVLRRYYPVVMGAVPENLGAHRGASLPDDTIAIIQSVQLVPDRRSRGEGGRLLQVTATKASPYSGTDSVTGAVEIERTRGLIRDGKTHWQGERAWKVPNDQATGFADALWDDLFPSAFPGWWTPRCTWTRVEPHGWGKNFATVRARYITKRTPGKARLVIETKHYEGLKLYKDKDDKTVEGPDLHSDSGKPDGVHQWKVVAGDNVQLTPFCWVTLKTAYYANQFQMADSMRLYNTVNDRTLPNFGNAQRGTMRFMGVSVNWPWGDDLLNIDYAFMWSGNIPWNELVRSQKGLWLVLKTPVFAYDSGTGIFSEALDANNQTEHNRHIVTYLPGERYKDGTVYKHRNVPPESRRLFAEGDFSALDALVEW